MKPNLSQLFEIFVTNDFAEDFPFDFDRPLSEQERQAALQLEDVREFLNDNQYDVYQLRRPWLHFPIGTFVFFDRTEVFYIYSPSGQSSSSVDHEWLTAVLHDLNIRIPPDFARLVLTGQRSFGKWWLLDRQSFEVNRRSLSAQMPGCDFLPFARAADQDQVACLVLKDSVLKSGAVITLHDGAMPGVGLEKTDLTFEEWFRSCRP